MTKVCTKLIVIAIVLFSLSIVTNCQIKSANSACASCHKTKVNSLAESKHADVSCQECHDGTETHLKDEEVTPKVRFDLELCGKCHPDQYKTYIKDQPMKTLFGGSINPPSAWPKTKDFPYYNVIIDGYGFVKEYNEERAHKYMLDDFRSISRFKYETCLQCKSTKIAYYWGSGKPQTIKSTLEVTSGHYKGVITIPKETKIFMTTDRTTPHPETGRPNHEVKVKAVLPDGRTYTSYSEPGALTAVDSNPDKAKEARIWLWATVYAFAADGLGKNSPSLIRKSLLVVRRLEAAPRQDQTIALCAQCHVEYVCGNSAIDKTDRDFFPWAKVGKLDSTYRNQFNYDMDWIHGTGIRPWQSNDPAQPGYYPAGSLYPIGEKLIKSQHPESLVHLTTEVT